MSRLRILSVGSNAISAFYSWRLQASSACEVTVVWRSHYEAVSAYGIAFRSSQYGDERFKPMNVVRAVEDAVDPQKPFDYIFVCVKALPDVYDLASVIEAVVTPSHTCILLNTTNTLGIERLLEERFPKNLVLSLVSGANLVQSGPADFEHSESSEVWIGAARRSSSISVETQQDMTESLALTLEAGQVECHVSENILQQQWERMIGPIAFHPVSVLFEEPNHSVLLEQPLTNELINDIITELLSIAQLQNCHFDSTFRGRIIESAVLASQQAQQSMMYQDFVAKRPMEIESFLANPLKAAKEVGIKAPHLQCIYAIAHNVNRINQTKTASPPSNSRSFAPQRVSSAPPMPASPVMAHRPMSTRPPQGEPRRPLTNGGSHPPPSRSGGYRNIGYSPPTIVRQNSLEGLEEFADIALYGDQVGQHPGALPDDDGYDYRYTNGNDDPHPRTHQQNRRPPPPLSHQDLALRERELALRQRELAIREREMNCHVGRGGKKGPMMPVYDDGDEDDDYGMPPPRAPVIDPDSVDMMSVTSRKFRRGPTKSNTRAQLNSEFENGGRTSSLTMRSLRSKNFRKDRTASSIPPADISGILGSINDDPLNSLSTNRYPTVDTKTLTDNSRANSLTASRMEELRISSGGPYPSPNSYRSSPHDVNNQIRNYPHGQSPGGRLPPAMASQQQPFPNTHGAPMPRGPPVRVNGKLSGHYKSVTGSASASMNGSASTNSSSNSSLEHSGGMMI